MNNKNKNYRVMKFLEPVNKKDKSKGYIRLDIRGIRGSIIVSVENLGDSKSNSEVYLYKDKNDKIKVGTVNNKKGMIKRSLSLSNNDSNIEDYNVCGVVNNNKIVLYATLFNTVSPNDIKKLEQVDETESLAMKEEVEKEEVIEKSEKLEMDCSKEVEKVEEKEMEISKTDELLSGNKNQEDEENNEFEQSEQSEQSEQVQNGDEDDEYDISESIDEEEINQDDVESVGRRNHRKQFKNKFEENLFNVLKDFEELEPLSVNIKNLSWWKINYSDTTVHKGILPYYNQIISTYYPYPVANRITTCHNLMRKYGYYIFGVYREGNEIKKLVYGVPGEFKREEQPYKGITGFKNWSYKNKNIKGDHGFWLAFIDSNTGEVSVPPNLEDN